MGRATTAVLAAAIGLGSAWAGAGTAAAVPAAGEPAGAVVISAKNLGNCKVEFEIVNKTNVTTYTIDWRIDGEDGRDVAGLEAVNPIYRTGGISSKAAVPSWPDGGAGENTVENRTMVSNRDPVTATYVRDLKNLGEPPVWNPPLPNPDADTHRVQYRMVLGPPGNNGQTTDGTPEWLGDRQWREVTVTGCNSPAAPGGSSEGSLGTGSLGFGSLGG